MLQQIKNGALDFLETLSEGWRKMISRSGRALTRFTRGSAGDDEAPIPGEPESWGLMAGEVAETDSHLIVRLEAPGMSKEDFNIQVEGGTLLVRGEKRFHREHRDVTYHLFEAAYGAFERAIALPRDVQPDGAEATYRRGVLTVRLPRAKSRAARRISVG